MSALSQWLQLMLAEIARKQEDLRACARGGRTTAHARAGAGAQPASAEQVRSTRR